MSVTVHFVYLANLLYTSFLSLKTRNYCTNSPENEKRKRVQNLSLIA